MVAFLHIEYSTYQFSEESKGVESPPPPGPWGTEKSVIQRGLNWEFNEHLSFDIGRISALDFSNSDIRHQNE